MNPMFFSMKPLYAAQREFEYRRHKKRLESISSDRPKLSLNNKHEQINKMRQRSCEFKLQQRIDKQNYQNTKLLHKLLEISNKKSASFDTFVKDDMTTIRPNDPETHFVQNPFRKRQQREISIQNSMLGDRLLQQKSQFSDLNTEKSIQEYVKIKKSMQRNRKIKFQPFQSNGGNSYMSRVSVEERNKALTECRNCDGNDRVDRYRNQFSQEYNKEIHEFQRLKYEKMRTQPTKAHQNLVQMQQ